MKNKWNRRGLGLVAVLLLALAYLFQRYDFSALFGIWTERGNASFIINKTVRFLMNESACLLLMVAIFNERKYVQIGFMLFLAELIVLLPFYFILKLSWEGDSEISSPLLSQLHRMIVNPLLMFILMLGMFYQNIQKRRT